MPNKFKSPKYYSTSTGIRVYSVIMIFFLSNRPKSEKKKIILFMHISNGNLFLATQHRKASEILTGNMLKALSLSSPITDTRFFTSFPGPLLEIQKYLKG